MNKNNKDKFDIVINKNTFYFYNPDFQEKYESYINSLTETLLVMNYPRSRDSKLDPQFIPHKDIKITGKTIK